LTIDERRLAEAPSRPVQPTGSCVESARRVPSWAYEQAELAKATVWERGGEGFVTFDHRWRSVLLA
jgi:hypothetical protein